MEEGIPGAVDGFIDIYWREGAMTTKNCPLVRGGGLSPAGFGGGEGVDGVTWAGFMRFVCVVFSKVVYYASDGIDLVCVGKERGGKEGRKTYRICVT